MIRVLGAGVIPTKLKLAAGILIAMFVGCIVGATAIGAGIIAIPTLLVFFNISPSRAVGILVCNV